MSDPSVRRMLIGSLAEAPDGHLAEPLAKSCGAFRYESDEQAIRFLRDLRDKAVYTGGASPMVMHLFSMALDDVPESEEDRDQRHRELERRWLGAYSDAWDTSTNW